MAEKPKLTTSIDSLLVGRIEAFGPNGEPSAINKQPVLGGVRVSYLGFEGDQQADTRVHGGKEKAIHHYPAEHYDCLKKMFPEITTEIGSFGENISTRGITESDLCLGDIFSIGDVVVQVSQSRQPCWKLNVRFNQTKMARIIQQNGWTGWYYRVLEEGDILVGDQQKLIDRPYPEANLARIQHYQHNETMNTAAMRELLQIPLLPKGLLKTFENRLRTGIKESDAKRINTPL